MPALTNGSRAPEFSLNLLGDKGKFSLDQARAQEARRRAQERLAQSQSEIERAELQGALERAVARLRVAELTRRRGRRRIEMPRSEQ